MNHKMRCWMLGLASLCGLTSAAHADYLSDYPHLKQFLAADPHSNFLFGFGVSPLRLTRSKASVAINLFELYWETPRWDIELFSASFGTTLSSEATGKVHSYTFRASPKIRFFKSLSVGPLFGFELVEFPEISARIGRNNLYTPIEPFSSRGLILGGCLSEEFELSNDYRFKLNQIFYVQRYSTSETNNGWEYHFMDPDLNIDRTPVAPGLVLLLEASLLY